MSQVCIERLERQGQAVWQVRFGRRTLTFHEELSARAFAAQLHMRLTQADQRPQSEDRPQ
ncbi:hypothetical protein [Pseudomonas sp. C11]|jgi:hypothetical protein|uniref:hypothetical protein n=1 Tax=Pseudomonas sp. C11 TaxID=3075550 RepID=UPI002AFEF485|nr:hypothetical protein [Pseudomonas sp. C11]